MTPVQFLNKMEGEVKLRNREDYKNIDTSFESDMEVEDQYDKLHLFLSDRTLKSSLCCPKFAPLKKVKRSRCCIRSFIFLNVLLLVAADYFFYVLRY